MLTCCWSCICLIFLELKRELFTTYSLIVHEYRVKCFRIPLMFILFLYRKRQICVSLIVSFTLHQLLASARDAYFWIITICNCSPQINGWIGFKPIHYKLFRIQSRMQIGCAGVPMQLYIKLILYWFHTCDCHHTGRTKQIKHVQYQSIFDIL